MGRKFLLLLPLFLAGPVAMPDKLVLHDGRVIEECKLEKQEQEQYVVLPHGRLRLYADQVREIYIDKDETYEPRNDYEREQLENGFVFFEGTWRTKRKRDAILEERREEREKKLKGLMRRLEWESAWRKETPHFLFITNTSKELLDYYSESFEDFYQSFTKRWGVTLARGSKKGKPTIKIFRSREQYLASGAPIASTGIFNTVSEELKLYHDTADPRFTLDVLFHEGTHLMVYLLRPDFIFPVWLNEGLAEYYGASTIDEYGKIEAGHLQEGRLAILRYALAEERYIPLTKVLLTNQRGFGSIHYAEAWCLVHFLMEHKKYKSKFYGFFGALAKGTGLEEVRFPVGKGREMSTMEVEKVLALFMKKLGLVDMSELEKEFLEYVYYGLPEVGPRGFLASARIRFRDRDAEGAIEDLLRALNLGSLDPTSFLYCGRIYGLKGEYEKSAMHYMKAIELDPLNPDYHLEIGLSLRASEDVVMMEEGLRHIYLATEVAPNEPRFFRSLEQALSGEDLDHLRDIKRRWEESGSTKGSSRKEGR